MSIPAACEPLLADQVVMGACAVAFGLGVATALIVADLYYRRHGRQEFRNAAVIGESDTFWRGPRGNG